MRPVATLVISIAMALGAIGLAVAAPGGLVGGQERASAQIQAASGAVSIGNSRAGQALFSAEAMRPGEGVSGTVTIGNSGNVAGRFTVQAAGVQDMPGVNGGKLSERVRLVLFDVTDMQNPVTVYAGTPADFSQVVLGVITPGRSRDYLFAATLPDGGGDGTDNLFQGAGLSLGFEWRAGPAAVGSNPPPTTTPTLVPTPTPTATPTPATPAPTATPTPAPAIIPPVALADALGLPAPTSCFKRGRLTLRLKAPAGAKVLSATVKVNGRVKARLKGAKAAKPVTLRGLKKKTKLAISIKAGNGRTYSASRTYSPCKR